MKRKLFLLLMLITLSFTVYSEPINNNAIESMIETFLNKGTYIKVHYNFNDKSEFKYYPKNYISYLTYVNNENSFKLYINIWSVSAGKLHDYQHEYNSNRYNFSLDINNNLIINH